MRGQVMLTMADVASQRGYAETRVQDVLERAEISRKTFYEHFSNRLECFLAAYDAIVADVDAALSAERPTVGELIGGLLEYFECWPAHARVLVTEAFAAGPQGVARHERMVGLVAERLTACEPWQPGDCAGLERDELAQATVGGMLRVIQRRLVSGGAERLPALAPVLVALTTRIRLAA
jgi:AcrR family transcriptional regulator